uniref:Guanine nucleotide-binding protein-like 1 n=1 Tax=Taeniopygia guttata TaxID=59729 RepID=A0A674GME3_TAEGU
VPKLSPDCPQALGVPPALAAHVSQDLAKGLILILNKVDLVPPAVATAWSHLLRARHGPARVVPFCTAPGPAPGPGTALGQKKRGGRWSRAVGPRLLLEACEEIVGGAGLWGGVLGGVWGSWGGLGVLGGVLGGQVYGEGCARPRPGLPNAGKSSVLNALLGRGAVGVSRAPGRTRYFQTHFLTAAVRLCDCPGLVFPSRAPPELQVLAGVYPIAQLQDPYSAVGFLGSRLALPPLLQLRPPGDGGWTAWELCEAWAEKRGYKTARAARNDVARAANGLLRLAAEGRLRLCFRPPGYSQEKGTKKTQNRAPPPAGPAPSSEDEGEESEQATPPPSPAPNPFALLGEDEC